MNSGEDGSAPLEKVTWARRGGGGGGGGGGGYGGELAKRT